MANRNDRWLDHTGLNVIRIVIGSYFLAISIGLVQGFDQTALFIGLLPPEQAALAGSAFLMVLSLTFMTGIMLRLSALMLSLFVLCSSLMQSFVMMEPRGLSAFWRDMALVCAILLCYTPRRRRDVRKVRSFLREGSGWISRSRRTGDVRPRRVALPGKTARRPESPDYQRMLRPLIAPTGPIRQPGADASNAAPRRAGIAGEDRATRGAAQAPLLSLPPTVDDDEECENIFSNV